MRTNKVGALVTLAVLLALVCLASPLAGAKQTAGEPPAEQGVQVAAAVSPLLQYQGRLLDPPTGEPVTDTDYTMRFSIYTVDSGGTALWTDTKIVPVENGLFSTVLGDNPATPLDQALFNGQALWLGVQVGTDSEAAPRQPLLPVPYALGLVPGAVIDVDNADVADGALSPAKIAGTAWTGANHGAGSGLDADLLDGQDSSAFVNTAGPDAISGSSADPILAVNQSGDGIGMVVNTANGEGVWSEANGPNSALVGLNTGTGSGVGGYSAGDAGYGGRFYSASGTALYADGAVQSTADSYWWYDANGLVPTGGGTTGDFVLVHLWTGGVMLECTVTGEDFYVLPLDVPGVLYGQPVRVEEVTVYYRTTDASTFIDTTWVFVSTGAGSSDHEEIASNETDQTSTTATSYSVPVHAGGYLLSSTSGSLLADFDLQCGQMDHNIYISGVRLRLGHTE